MVVRIYIQCKAFKLQLNGKHLKRINDRITTCVLQRIWSAAPPQAFMEGNVVTHNVITQMMVSKGISS